MQTGTYSLLQWAATASPPKRLGSLSLLWDYDSGSPIGSSLEGIIPISRHVPSQLATRVSDKLKFNFHDPGFCCANLLIEVLLQKFSLGQQWREYMGIEPTKDVSRPFYWVEASEAHQDPSTPLQKIGCYFVSIVVQ